MFVLIGIASTVIYLGQDLISADKKEKIVYDPLKSKERKQEDLFQKNKPLNPNGDGDQSDDLGEGSDDTDSSGDNDNETEDTERMEVNGKEVNIKKSELDQVWKEVESELKQQDKETDDLGVDIGNEAKSKITQNALDSGPHSDDHHDAHRDDHDDDTDIDTDHETDDDDDDGGEIDSHHDDKHDLDAVFADAHHSEDGDDGNDGDDGDSQTVQIGDKTDDKSPDAAKEETSPHGIDENEKDGVLIGGKKKDSSSSSEKTASLDSEDLSRLFYPEYYSLPTFFDIDPNDVEALVSYWKAPGVYDYRNLTTKYRFLQKDDLKQTIFQQDEHHNPKLTDFYNSKHERSHILNTDFEYLYPFTIPLESYPPHLLTPETFKYNLTKFLSEEIGHYQSRYAPKWDIFEIFAAHNHRYKMIISKQEMYAKHEQYLRDHHQDVELIFPENDTLFFAMMTRFGERLKATVEKEEADESDGNIGGRFLRALKKVEDEKDRRMMTRRRRVMQRRRRRLREGFGLFDHDDDDADNEDGDGHSHRSRVDLSTINKEELSDSVRKRASPPRIHNFNGMTSDITYFHRNRSTPQYLHNSALDDPRTMFMAGNMNFGDAMAGEDVKLVKNDRFWRLHDHCTRRKSSTVYPNWRILYKTKPLTCDVILERLIAPIANCLEEHGYDCPDMIDHGYFRFVFKAEAPAKYLYADARDPEEVVPIVLKVMKTQFVEWSTDWMRHIREAIFLQQLSRWEEEFMKQFGPQFVSEGRDRAFYFVPELGHCLYPTYITVTPFYGGNLKQWHNAGLTMNMTLRTATEKALEIVHGLQIMHNIEGGPYMHTDLQPRQFMIDREGNILINDFNRGKFTEYYFKNAVEGGERKKMDLESESDLIIPCTYCMPGSHGHYRAPEEYYSDPLSEKLDIWSLSLTIWSMFTGEKPWSSFGRNYAAVKYVTRDYQMRPKLPYNMPPYLKDLFRQCWRQNMWDRPDINELMRKMRYFYKHLHRLSDGREHLTLDELYRLKAFKETNFPDLDNIRQHLDDS